MSETSPDQVAMTPIRPHYFPWKEYQRYTYPLGIDLGDVAFLSGLTASAFDVASGKVHCQGSLTDQIDTVVAKICATLEAAAYSPAHSCSTRIYLPRELNSGHQEVVDSLATAGFPAASCRVLPVTRLLRRDALVEVEVVVCRSQGAEKLKYHDWMTATSGWTFKASAQGESVVDELVSQTLATLEERGIAASQIGRAHLMTSSSDEGLVRDLSQHAAWRRLGWDEMPVIVVQQRDDWHPTAELHLDWIGPEAVSIQEARSIIQGAMVRRSGRYLLLTGVRARTPRGRLMDQVADVYGQMLPQFLAGFGTGMHRIVRTVEWVTADTLSEYRETATVRRALLTEPFPVASGLVCDSLTDGADFAADVLVLLN